MLLLVVLLSGLGSAAAATRVTDSVGRSAEVPDRIGRVFAAGPPASILLYTLAPDLLLGWNRAPTPAEARYMPREYVELPELGRLTGRANTANVEVVLAARPDLIIDYGSLRPTYVSLADRVQNQTGIPYLLLDGSFEQIPTVYRLLGRVLGREDRAEQLAVYAEQALALAESLRERAGDQGPRVYYGRGPNGQETGLGGSINTELLDRVGARNVAAESGIRGGLTGVSLESILAWNPDHVLTLDDRFFALLQIDPVWQGLAAVREGRTYLAPRLPFGWFDRPPSVNRIIGVHWLAQVLYPDSQRPALASITRDFYRLFYHVELSDEDLSDLLRHADRAPKP